MESLPIELHAGILTHLSRSDLKNIRLVCKLFTLVAEEPLFRKLILTPNTQSLRRVTCIACHQRLRLHVRALLVDGKWLVEKFKEYDTWLKTIQGPLPNEFTPIELRNHHTRYLHYVQGQQNFRKSIYGFNTLHEAFKVFPKFDSIDFDSGTCLGDWVNHGIHEQGVRTFGQTWGFIAQETLTIPRKGNREDQTMQVKAILHAARAPDLHLRGSHAAETKWNSLDLMSQTPEIDETFASLRHLTLHGFGISENTLKDLLKLHAPTLRSLQLSTINILRDKDQEAPTSWISIIRFLRSSLSLDRVCLGGGLKSEWGEVWCSNASGQSERWYESEDFGLDCLRSRIERYITGGGPCPLSDSDKTCPEDQLDRSFYFVVMYGPVFA